MLFRQFLPRLVHTLVKITMPNVPREPTWQIHKNATNSLFQESHEASIRRQAHSRVQTYLVLREDKDKTKIIKSQINHLEPPLDWVRIRRIVTCVRCYLKSYYTNSSLEYLLMLSLPHQSILPFSSSS